MINFCKERSKCLTLILSWHEALNDITSLFEEQLSLDDEDKHRDVCIDQL